MPHEQACQQLADKLHLKKEEKERWGKIYMVFLYFCLSHFSLTQMLLVCMTEKLL